MYFLGLQLQADTQTTVTLFCRSTCVRQTK